MDIEPSGQPSSDVANRIDMTRNKVDHITKLLDDMDNIQTSARRLTYLLVFAIVAGMSLWGWATYNTVRSNFRQDKIRYELQQVAETMAPRLEGQLRTIQNEIMPVYSKEFTKEFEKVAPKLSADLNVRANKMPNHLESELRKQLHQWMVETVKRLDPDLKTVLPGVTDESRLRDYAVKLDSKIREEHKITARHIERRFSNDTNRMGKAILAFQDAELPPLPDHIEMERQFVHLLLAWTDNYIMTPTDARAGMLPSLIKGKLIVDKKDNEKPQCEPQP